MKLWTWLVGEPFVSWNTQVLSLKSETPLRLPPIRPLQAQRVTRSRRTKKHVTKREISRELFLKKRA